MEFEFKPHLEYLAAREQLMEDISAIVEEWDSRESPDSLISTLCDAVCKHFPTQAQDAIQSVWVPKSLPIDS